MLNRSFRWPLSDRCRPQHPSIISTYVVLDLLVVQPSLSRLQSTHSQTASDSVTYTQKLDVAFSSDNAGSSSTPKGLVPYVDLITRLGHRNRCARRNRSPSLVIETPDISPHKRRKLQKDYSLGEKLSPKVNNFILKLISMLNRCFSQFRWTLSDRYHLLHPSIFSTQVALDSQVVEPSSLSHLQSTYSQTASGSDTYVQELDKAFSSDNAWPSSTPRDTSGLVPYVDLITQPGHRNRRARRNQSPSPVIESLDISPNKRRKLQGGDSLGEKLSFKVYKYYYLSNHHQY